LIKGRAKREVRERRKGEEEIGGKAQ